MRLARVFSAAITSIIAVAVLAACGLPSTGDGEQSLASQKPTGQVSGIGQGVSTPPQTSPVVEVTNGGIPDPLPSKLLLPANALPKLQGYTYVGHPSLRSTLPPSKVPFVGFISLGIAKNSNMIGSIIMFKFAPGHSDAELTAAANDLVWKISPGFESRAISIHGLKVAEIVPINHSRPVTLSFREQRNLVSVFCFTGRPDAEKIADLFLRATS